MTSVGLVREKTFEDAIRSKATRIDPPYRPYTELQRDPKILAFNFQASLDEVRELELRAQLHRNRMQDIAETASRMGIPTGHVLATQPPKPVETSGMVDPEHTSKVEMAEDATEADILDLATRVQKKSGARGI